MNSLSKIPVASLKFTVVDSDPEFTCFLGFCFANNSRITFNEHVFASVEIINQFVKVAFCFTKFRVIRSLFRLDDSLGKLFELLALEQGLSISVDSATNSGMEIVVIDGPVDLILVSLKLLDSLLADGNLDEVSGVFFKKLGSIL